MSKKSDFVAVESKKMPTEIFPVGQCNNTTKSLVLTEASRLAYG